MPKPVIYALSGESLTTAERDFFSQTQPLGFILFTRNLKTPQQATDLITELKSLVNHDIVPLLIDQEGGRVARLRPPHWHDLFPMQCVGDCYHLDHESGLRAAYLSGRVIGHELHSIGINVDCNPVLDLRIEGADAVIGDRAYSSDPQEVSLLASQVIKGMMDAGVLPVIKHIPGHGRALVDSHLNLPVIDTDLATLRESDFIPFKNLNAMPYAMTAHIVYEDIDAQQPLTFSAKAVQHIIRDDIGFKNLLMSDAIDMQALSGTMAERAQKTIAAGCDIVLHCTGEMAEMREIDSVLTGMPPHRHHLLRQHHQMTVLKDDGYNHTTALDELNDIIKMLAHKPLDA